MLKQIPLILFVIALVNVVRSEVYSLPKSVKPERYIITMEPNLTYVKYENGQFVGSIIMELKALENTKNITFHSLNLDINPENIDIINSKGMYIEIENTSEDEINQIFTVHLKNELIQGQLYNLTIDKFAGELQYNGLGFFKAGYYHNNSNRLVAVTHFEPTWARAAFPCFDEPALKANFIINIIRKTNYISLSNEILETTEDLGDGRFKDTFKETPTMSTYLVAFTVSDFKATKKVDRHQFYAKESVIDNGELNFSLDVAVKAMKALEEFTGIDYALSKVDHFAVPRGYFRHYAMENWGLIIYGEEFIRSTNRTSRMTKQDIATYISHEFAHQWFGNLVTPASWDYIWISESLSAYFQYYITSMVKQPWRLMDQFIIEVVLASFNNELFIGAHPLNYHIKRNGQFPPFHIMYEKGASITRMMSHFLSNDIFQKGLNKYLREKKYGVAVPNDLYNNFQKAVDEAKANYILENMTVAEIMSTWDSSRGFPVISVNRNYETGAITLKQRSKFDNGTLWKIPINKIFSSNDKSEFLNTVADFWLTEEEKTFTGDFPTDGWLLVNKQLTGYYRVNYDEENWKRIIHALKSDKLESIHVLNRAQLIHDALYFASIDELPFATAMELCEYLEREKDYIPFASFYDGMSSYVNIYSGSAVRESESEYFLNHPIKNTIASPDKSGYKEDYLIFQEFIRTIMKNIREYLKKEENLEADCLNEKTRNEMNRYFPFYFKD